MVKSAVDEMLRSPSVGSGTPPASGAVLAGGGEMGALMRSYDWSRTPVGPVESWPQSLRTAVSILLDSRYPMYISWGPEFVQFYNDGYVSVLGTKHPGALGRSTFETWAEVWNDIVGPLFRKVKAEAEPVFVDDFLFPLHRYGYTEECYFTFCYSPIREESGAVGGVFVTCIETTARMVGERRLRTLRELAGRAAEARCAAEACANAAAVLGTNAHDVPFSSIYLVDDANRIARRAGNSGLDALHPANEWVVDISRESAKRADSWPLAHVAASGEMLLLEDLAERFPALPGGPWPEAPSCAAIVPVPRAGQSGLSAIIVAGISPRRRFDDEYRGFFDLVAGHLSSAIGNARAYEDERKRAESLAELDRAKTVFFSNVSHEFRTPLTLLLGPTEQVLKDPRHNLDPRYRSLLDTAHRNGLRLLRLVNTLLDFSRIEAGRIEAVYEATDAAALTAELASGFRSAVERAGLQLIVDCPTMSEPLYIDRGMWEKIVLNLLSNAFKHTFEGEIVVMVRRLNNEAELIVRDTGVGIAREDLPRLFERFHRVTGARSRTHEGSGIGLALVQELAELHGGSVQVESRENQGSVFSVRIPFGTAHLPQDRVGAERSRPSPPLGVTPFLEEALRWLPDGQEPTAAAAALQQPHVDSARILLADDNADMREYVTRLLAERGWSVVAVGNGQTALDKAVENPPDLVVTDVMMPGLDGFALLRALRTQAATRTVPVIVLSARAGEESRVEGLNAGADDYLVKPFTAQELVARVNTHLSLARIRGEAEAEKTRLLEEAHSTQAELEATAASLQQAAIELEMQSAELQAATDELQEVNQRLSASEARLRLANTTAGIGTWELDVESGEFLCDDQCQEVLGIKGRAPAFDDFVGVSHPHHKWRVDAVLKRARTEESAFAHMDFDIEFRAFSEDAPRWVRLTGRTFYGSGEGGGRARRMFGTVHDTTARRRGEEMLREEAQIVGTIQRVGSALISELDLSALVQMVTDEATRLTGAQFGAFFYNVLDEAGESYTLYSISGVPREMFSKFPMPRNTHVFEPTFRGTGIVRSDDITADPRYGQNPPYHGMPEGHLAVVSYLAVPVISRSGEVLGGLFFGHEERGVFDERHERLAVGIAGWAAVAIDNARLYDRERRARTDAESARREAELANKAKTEFLATMSHELRTPLNAIAGYVDLLDLEIRGPITEQQRADLRRINRSQQHLLGLINDVLNFAKLEAGQVEIHTAPVDVSAMLNDIEQLVAPQMAAKSLKYACSFSAPDVAVRADEEKARQIILNLLTNAVKFTDAGGQVRVGCVARKDAVEITVSDTGRGIPADKLERIFEPFVQVDRHLTPSSAQGVGLGLAISRDLARAMNGDIRVESKQGAGTTFTFSLPRAH